MSIKTQERGWLSVAEAGKYVGINPEIIKCAIESGELLAYIKPRTSPEKLRVGQRHIYYKIAICDLDDWVRSWPTSR